MNMLNQKEDNIDNIVLYHYSAVIIRNESHISVWCEQINLITVSYTVNCVQVNSSPKVAENELPLILPKHNILLESTNNLEGRKVLHVAYIDRLVQQKDALNTLKHEVVVVSANWAMLRLQHYLL